MITLYHPALNETVEVPTQRSAEVLKRSGWTEELPSEESNSWLNSATSNTSTGTSETPPSEEDE